MDQFSFELNDEMKFSSNAEARQFLKGELIYNVTEDLLVIMEHLDVSHAELARRMGKSKSFVSQLLSGARNMTLSTLSDVCFALSFKPRIALPVPEAHEEAAHSDWRTVQNARKDLTPRKRMVTKTNVVKVDFSVMSYKVAAGQ